jgi:PelA/Pel-15E family pectate lyase
MQLVRALLLLALCATSLPSFAQNESTRPRNYPVNWWPRIEAHPDSWHRSDAGRNAANNALTWQAESGGWPLMVTINEPWTGDETAAGPWGRRGALIKSTVNELRLLARGYRVTKDERYRKAVEKGLDFIFRAQYPTGGWPHSYPVFSNPYDHYSTFNDDEIPDLMRLVREAATEKDFAWLGSQHRKAAQETFDRGVQFILNTQQIVGGKRTVWCQQYDDKVNECRSARKFEPVALSGSESAGVLILLMSIERPSAEVAAAIRAGAEWYEAAKIKGVRIERTDNDRIARDDPTAPPLWARFYEMSSGRPIFAGRDGVIKYRMSEIEQERRGGYAWYGNWGVPVLVDYKKWKERIEKGDRL